MLGVLAGDASQEMKNTAEHTNSIWMATSEIPVLPALSADMKADVCIVGAGITGLTTAYLMGLEGKSVVVLDAGPIGGGETSRTTAHLATALDHRYFDLERIHGEKGARLAAESHGSAIERIAAIVAEEQIQCDFERLPGYLFVPSGESTDVLDKELEAAQRAGLTEVGKLERAPIRPFNTGPCLRFPHQAQFHPLKYLQALAKAIERKGGRIFTGTHAEKFEAGPPGRVSTAHGPVVTADAIVVATNTPVNDLVRVHTKQAAYRTYVIAARVPKELVTPGLYWDTADPFHYVRLQREAGHDRRRRRLQNRSGRLRRSFQPPGSMDARALSDGRSC